MAVSIEPKQDAYVILLTNCMLMGGSGEAFLRMRRQVSEAVLRALASCETWQ